MQEKNQKRNDTQVVSTRLKFRSIYDMIFSVMEMELPQRKQNRLENYDYGQIGCYFVTLCTLNRQRLFEIDSVGNDLCVVPPLQNQIIHKWLGETENKFQNIKIEKYVIMPDHIHLLIHIAERHAGRSLQDAIRFFKAMTTNEYIRLVKEKRLPLFDKKLWQKSYYDHIIRNQADYDEVWQYIENNPAKWKLTHETQDD